MKVEWPVLVAVEFVNKGVEAPGGMFIGCGAFEEQCVCVCARVSVCSEVQWPV